jgi:endonuclease/exonuclease/phosphatase (EEP) superfamily protein YafD
LFELIENDISMFSENGSVIIMGDMNARTGNESDFIENEFHN